jgi:hypothetical protein
VLQRQFGFVVTIGIQMVIGNVHVLLDQIGDSMEGGGLGDFNITSHGWLLKKKYFPSLQAPL